MRCPWLPLTLAGLLIPSALCAQTATGRMIVNGKEHVLKYARAGNIPDDKDVLRVVLTDTPLPPKALADEMELMSLGHDGKIHGIQLDFRENGVSWMLRTNNMEGSYSASQSPNPFPLKIGEKQVEGEVVTKQDPERTPSYDISVKFSAPIEKFVPEPEPTAADAEAAKNSAPAKAYLALQDAIRKGDRAGILAAAPAQARSQIEGPDFPKMLELVQAMQLTDIRINKAVEKGGEATLWVVGVEGGAEKHGEVTLRSEGGKWIMVHEKWRAH